MEQGFILCTLILNALVNSNTQVSDFTLCLRAGQSRCVLCVFQVLDGLLAQCGTVENCEQGKACALSSCVPDVPHMLTRC